MSNVYSNKKAKSASGSRTRSVKPRHSEKVEDHGHGGVFVLKK